MRTLLCWAFLCGLLIGCGSQKPPEGADVLGKVSNGGQPVTDAIIVFEDPGTAYSVWATLDEQGGYRSPNLPPGKYQVAVRPRGAAPAPDDPNTEGTSPTGPTNPLVPEKFHDSQTSGLTIEVQQGAPVQFDFDLGN